MPLPRYYLIILLLLTVYSCGQRNSYPFELMDDPESKFVINLDSITPASTKMLQIFDENQKITSPARLAMLNAEMQLINIHDHDGKKIKEIRLSDIDSTVKKISGFHFIDNDSLLLYSYTRRQMELISCGNKFPKSIVFHLDSIKIPGINKLSIETSTTTPIIYQNGKVYVAGRAMFNELSKPQLTKVNTAFCVNLKNKEVDFLPVFESIWKERYWHFEQTFINHLGVPQNNKVVYSLHMKDTVVVYNTETKEQLRASVPSEEIGNQDDMVPDIDDVATLGSYEDLQSFLSKPRYGTMLFDKYRNIYYRFVSKGNSSRTTSIIICDAKLRKIGETLIKGAGLGDGGSFIAKEGLFLRDRHIKGEDKIVYRLFKLKKIA